MLDATQRRREAARAKLLAQLEIFEGDETSLKEKLEYIRKKIEHNIQNTHVNMSERT